MANGMKNAAKHVGGGGDLSGLAALYQTGLRFPGQYWGLVV